MNDSPHRHRYPPTTDRPGLALVVGLFLVLSVPLALWALANPLIAALLVGTGSVTVALATHRRPSEGDRRASDG